jgi:hypothetical protein
MPAAWTEVETLSSGWQRRLRARSPWSVGAAGPLLHHLPIELAVAPRLDVLPLLLSRLASAPPSPLLRPRLGVLRPPSGLSDASGAGVRILVIERQRQHDLYVLPAGGVLVAESYPGRPVRGVGTPPTRA